MNVLYVEDDPRDANLTRHTLAKTAPHLFLETVSNITEALVRLKRIDSEPLDLVLTDMHLPDGDGLSLLNCIRENSLPVAVVIITGVGDEETAVAALKARADDYVVKRKAYLDKLPVILPSGRRAPRTPAESSLPGRQPAGQRNHTSPFRGTRRSHSSGNRDGGVRNAVALE